MKTETEEYTAEEVTIYTGKTVKWVGKEVACGQWPEEGTGGYRIGIYQTKTGTWIADVHGDVYGSDTNRQDVVNASSKEELIDSLRRHEWAEEEHFMAALQNAFPDEEIWCEEIE